MNHEPHNEHRAFGLSEWVWWFGVALTAVCLAAGAIQGSIH